MSRVDDLIRELCPGGVSFRELATISRTLPGLSGKSKGDFTDGNARYVSYKNAFANIAVDQSASDFVRVDASEKQNRLQLGDVVITGSSESLDEVGLSSVVDAEPAEPLYLNSFCFVIRFDDPTTLLPGFSKYLFRADFMRSQIRKTANGVTRINVSKPRFAKIRIPIPPLEVQREIAKMLDQFTQLKADLEAELEARQQQYAVYRNRLLTYTEADDVRWLPLCKVADFKRGSAMTIRSAIPGKFRLVANSPNPIGTHNEANRDGEFLVIARSGAGAGAVSLWRGSLFLTDAFSVHPHARIASTRYIYYLLQNQQSALREMKSGGGVPHVRVKDVEAYRVPIPDLLAQERVVQVLDNFEALTRDLSVGLPAELAARRKQYEYYRDKLLTFSEAAS